MKATRRPLPGRPAVLGGLVLLGAMLLGLVACTPGEVATPMNTPSTGGYAQTLAPGALPTGSAPDPSEPACDPRGTYPPLPSAGRLPPANQITDEAMRAIKQRGHLVVGVSSDTRLLGSVVPENQSFEGFDIDIARAVAGAMFGDPSRIRFVSITAREREPVLESGTVDMVARAVSMTCDRWERIAFSAQYLAAHQRLLVHGPPGSSSNLGLSDMKDKKVCAPAGTSSLARLGDYPDVTPVAADNHTACLMLFQENEVDAITGDDTILAGLADQDAYAIVTTAPAIADEPYGLAFNKNDVELVRYVNAVLAQYATPDSSGVSDWNRSYDKWLRPLIGDRSPPEPVYDRELPDAATANAAPSARGA